MAIKFLNSVAVDTDVLFVDTANERVGIGTTSPTSILQVGDPMETNTLTIAGLYSAGGARLNFRSGHPSNSTVWNMGEIKVTDDGNYNGRIEFQTTASGGNVGAFPTTKMVLKANGNVGIGTTSPGTKLQVGSGSGATVDTGYQMVIDSAGIAGLQILSATTQSGRIVFGDSGDNDIGMIKYDHTDNSMGFRTNGSGNERMRITDAGNVGIGTTSPSSELEINGNVGYTSGNAIFPRTKGIAADWYTSKFDGGLNIDNSVGSSGNTAFRIGYWGSGTFAPNIKLSGGGGNTSYFASGNVGIGTTSPNFKLDVKSSTGDDGISISAPARKGIELLLDSGINGGGDIRMYSGVNVITNRFNAQGSSYINGGNVGIGTTSPVAKLHIENSSGANIILNSNTGLVNNGIYMSEGASSTPTQNGAYFYYDSSANAVKLDTGTSSLSTKLTVLRDSGNVGIGTTSPTFKLDVTGDGIRNTRATAGWAGWFENTGSSSGVIVTAGVDSGDAPLLIRKQDGTGLFSVRGNGVSWFNGGNVGIGTTSPNTALEVDGAISTTTSDYVQGTTGSRLLLETSGSGNTHSYIQAQSSGGTSNAEDLALQLYGGNVGIGTSSPDSKLQIKVGTDQNIGFNSHSSVARISSYNDAFTASSPLKINGSDLRFDISSVEKMRINASGNVSIGTTSAEARLHVAHNDGGVAAKFVHSGPGTGYAPGSILLQAGQGTSRGQGIYHYNTEADENWFTGVPYNVTSRKWIVANKPSTTFDLDTAQLSHALMTIDSDNDGNVGIGTTSPGEKLEVSGNVKAETLIATDLNDGYVPYSKSGTLGLQDSKIYTQGAGIGVGTTTLAAGCHITSLSDISATGYRVSAMQTAPAARNSTGTLGEIRITSNYIYVCYATNSWSRVALATSW